MFKCDYKTLRLSFNDFHNVDIKDMPPYGEFCLLELKDGRYTAGEWHPKDYKNKKVLKGEFIRGTADSVLVEEVKRWHTLDRDEISQCLEKKEINFINIAALKNEGSVVFENFKSCDKGEFPKEEQYCLLIMKDGGLAAGRWEFYDEKDGCFIYAPALGSHSMEKVWAWTPLSSDYFFEMEEESERERREEEELNRNPSLDENLFIYGTDINIYYEKALEKLRIKYPWASLAQMKKKGTWDIVPCHGKYVFGQVHKSFDGNSIVDEWIEDTNADELTDDTTVDKSKDGATADKFINYLCKYVREDVENSNPEVKFKYGTDIKVYLDKAYANVKKNYHWVTKKMLSETCRYYIKKIDGDLEFVTTGSDGYIVLDYPSADRFIESVEYDYQRAALAANPVVDQYSVPIGRVEINGWYLEHYIFYKLKTGDYKVDVQAGNRTTGGNREFFISPDCFKTATYEEFLDRYLKIVQESFGLGKKDLVSDNKLKKFLGY
ncbi:hypothetical protein SAMN02910289_00390 [Lachnospiraceae bacterium RM5]|nr:hypothetical protein SAMN02910289_00390 [Lachnospiraceae bacterium RM5]